MRGTFAVRVLCVLVAAQSTAGVAATPEWVSVSASGHAFRQTAPDVMGDAWELGSGTAALRVSGTAGTDAGTATSLVVDYQEGIHHYVLQLIKPQGTILNVDVFGRTGVGPPLTPARAAAVVWGSGTLTLDGSLLAEDTPIQAYALVSGFHADDETFRTLPQARWGDNELLVMMTGLPESASPSGLLELGFSGVQIAFQGAQLPMVTYTPSESTGLSEQAPGFAPLTAPTYVTLGTSTTVINFGNSALVSGPPPSSLGASLASSSPLGPPSVLTGIPASPPVANSGQDITPLQENPAPLNEAPATPLPEGISPANATPGNSPPPLTSGISPLNASPALPLITTPSPGNQGAPSVTLGVTPLIQTPRPLNAQVGLPLLSATPPNPGPSPAAH